MYKKAKKLLKKDSKLKTQVILSIIFSIGFFILSLGISYFIFQPKLDIKNEDKMTIKLNTNYREYGAKINYFVKNNYGKLEIIDNVDSKKPGIYRVYYRVKGIFGESVKFREVKVIDDIKPSITLIGENSRTICPNSKYVEEGYTASDNCDGDLTNKVQVIENNYQITYTVKDSGDNLYTTYRDIKKEDITKPEISLKGYAHLYLKVNDSYREEGYFVSDNCSDVSNKVIVSNNIDTKKIGTYTVTYTVEDESHNKNSIERHVTIYNPSNSNYNTVYHTNTIYLTFDDGPSNITSGILDILKEEGIKATFFVINKGTSYDKVIRRAYEEGHTIALHSSSHNYKRIYSSIDAYFNDLNAISEVVKRVTGTESKIIRFPGGSSNVVSREYYPGIMTILTNEVLARGYHYFDWNVESSDASSARNKVNVYNNVVNSLSHRQMNIVIMHDYEGNYKTLEALRDIINFGKANGYSYSTITMETSMIKHKLNN